MACPNLRLAFYVTISCLLGSAIGQTGAACSADLQCENLQQLVTMLGAVREEMADIKSDLEDLKSMREDQETVKQDQTDLKNHVLQRLDALDEKTAWCLSNGQKGAHPWDQRMSQMEQHLNSSMSWIKDFLGGPRDCQQLYDRGHRQSGVYAIFPDGVTKMDVYCEQELDGGGWMVFQRRQDGSVDFFRNWADYKTGFGDLNGEFWLGNDNLHLLTRGHDQKLKVELTYNNETLYADYSTFWIDNEALKYNLTVSGFSENHPPGDSLLHHNHSPFSTKDRDNDNSSSHCAQTYTGAWWYNSCHHSNLNGVYGNTDYAKGVSWMHWKGHYDSMTGTRVMMKRKI